MLPTLKFTANIRVFGYIENILSKSGQFGMPWDKRQPYEFDVRVPLAWRGPGVPLNVTVAHSALLIDLAPTLLQIAGAASDQADGVALQTLLPTADSFGSPPPGRSFLIEYSGEAHPDTVADECNLDKNQFFVRNITCLFIFLTENIAKLLIIEQK